MKKRIWMGIALLLIAAVFMWQLANEQSENSDGRKTPPMQLHPPFPSDAGDNTGNEDEKQTMVEALPVTSKTFPDGSPSHCMRFHG